MAASAAKRSPSIRQRTMRVVMTTTLVALLLSAAAMLLFELKSQRASWQQDLETQAELMAQSSAVALTFDDARVARENLALLRLRPQIEAAAIYDAENQLFADYALPGRAPWPTALAAAPAESALGGKLELRQPIAQNGQSAERLGTVVLVAQFDVLPRLAGYLAILSMVTLTSLILSGLVARRLQAIVTGPIVAVSEVAREVVQQRNYALRAPKTTDDEVGALVDAFNNMLGELGQQASALQAADRRKDEFLATLAHELRNPLAPVTTALAILARNSTDPATQARLVRMMQRQMQQIVRLIDDLMEVSRISTGRLTLRPERLDLVALVRGAVESVTPALLERKHTLVVVAWPETVWLEGDRTRLGQVFVNLLGNAAKYTDPGGRIEIIFELDPASATVHIVDNGIGIAAEMQQAVFEMFMQADVQSPARVREGLGVGLSLARQLVDLHHGCLCLHSLGLGAGSTFSVKLPREPTAPVLAAAAGAAPGPATSPSRRALLADDKHTNGGAGNGVSG